MGDVYEIRGLFGARIKSHENRAESQPCRTRAEFHKIYFSGSSNL